MNPGDEVWITDPNLARNVFRKALLDTALPDGSFILRVAKYMPRGGIGEFLLTTPRIEPYQGQEEWFAPDGTRLYNDPRVISDIRVEKVWVNKAGKRAGETKPSEEILREIGDSFRRISDALVQAIFSTPPAPDSVIEDIQGRRFRCYKGKDDLWVLEPIDEEAPDEID